VTVANSSWVPHIWIQPEPDEPVHGMMIRLCDVNGLPRMSHLERRAGLDLDSLRAGEQIDRLARILRCDPATLEDHVWQRPSKNFRVWRGVSVSAVKEADFVHRRACPECLSEKPYHRFHWDVAAISSCVRHERLLIGTCSCGQALSWWDGSLAKCRVCENGSISLVPAVQPDPEVMAFDAYLLGRLGAFPVSPDPILDPLEIRGVCDLVGRIGALDVLGFRRRWTEPGDGDLPQARVLARGYAIVSQGSLENLLDRIWHQSVEQSGENRPAIQRSPGIDQAYGWFVPWFRWMGGELFSPGVAAAIVRHASTKFMLVATNFPSTARVGDTMNMSQAARGCGTSVKTLRRLLEMEGYLSSDLKKGSPIRIERDLADRFAADLTDALTQVDLAEFTGLRIASVEQLCKANAIPCWLRGGGIDAHRYLYRRDDVAAWMNAIIGNPPDAVDSQADAVPIADYAAVKGISILDVVSMLEKRQLDIRIPAGIEANFATVVVTDLSLAAPDRKEAVGSRAVADRLGIRTDQVTRLADAGLLQRFDHPLAAKGRKGTWLEQASVELLVQSIEKAASPWEAGADHRKRTKIRLTKAVKRLRDVPEPWANVFTCIVDGALGVFLDRSASVSLAASLFVDDVDTVRRALRDGGSSTGMSSDIAISVHEAARRLGTRPPIVSACRKIGILGTANGHLGLKADDVDQFRDRFIMVDEIVRRGGFTHFTVTSALEAAGIEPAHRLKGSPARPGTNIYDRRKVETYLPSRNHPSI